MRPFVVKAFESLLGYRPHSDVMQLPYDRFGPLSARVGEKWKAWTGLLRTVVFLGGFARISFATAPFYGEASASIPARQVGWSHRKDLDWKVQGAQRA